MPPDEQPGPATLYCPTCKQDIPVVDCRPEHDVVYRLNSSDGPEPRPFLMLHAPT